MQITFTALNIFSVDVHPSAIKGLGRTKEGVTVKPRISGTCTSSLLALLPKHPIYVTCRAYAMARILAVCAPRPDVFSKWPSPAARMDGTTIVAHTGARQRWAET